MIEKITEEIRNQIGEMISSDQSVVGINAKETHIIIIHQLNQLAKQLERIEARLDRLEKNS